MCRIWAAAEKSANGKFVRHKQAALAAAATRVIGDLGGRASLVGLCQGGWLAAAYAARFPGKVAKLVLVGALGAAER